MKPVSKEVNLLRAFGALGVVLLHSLAGVGTNQVYDSVRPFLGYVIPIFIFISGFALTHSYKDENGEYRVFAFYKKRFGVVLLPYLVFANLYYAYALHNNYFPEDKTDFSHYVSYILFAKTYYHLWFFVILFQLYLLFPFLIRLYRKIENNAGIVLAATLIIQIVWNLFSDNYPRAQLGTIFPSLIFYFVLGMYFSANYERITIKLSDFNVFLPMVLFLGAGYAATHIESIKFILLPLSSVISFWMFFKIASMIKDSRDMFTRFLELTASLSFGIYLIHVFCIDFSRFVLGKSAVLYSSPLWGISLYCCAATLSILSCLLISKTPVGRYLIGTKR